MPEENTPEGTGKRIGKEILSFVLYFVIVIAAMLLIIHYVGQRTEVSGSSMENTLSDGDNLIVDKISYRFHDPERYDIIISHISMKKIPIISKDHRTSGRTCADR